ITADEVVVGVDLDGDYAPVLDYAFAAAEAREAPLRVMHLRRPVPLAVEARVDWRAATETVRERLSAALAPWRERHPDVKVAEEVFIGHPADALATASANAGLVVVGSRGRLLPLGSVSHAVLHHAGGPVAVVRPYERPAPRVTPVPARPAAPGRDARAPARRARVTPPGSGHQAVAVGVDDRLDAIAQVELGEDARDIGLDGLLADHQGLGDLAVGQAVGDEAQHLQLPRGQR